MAGWILLAILVGLIGHQCAALMGGRVSQRRMPATHHPINLQDHTSPWVFDLGVGETTPTTTQTRRVNRALQLEVLDLLGPLEMFNSHPAKTFSHWAETVEADPGFENSRATRSSQHLRDIRAIQVNQFRPTAVACTCSDGSDGMLPRLRDLAANLRSVSPPLGRVLARFTAAGSARLCTHS